MSIDEIISMAREAGFLVVTANLGGGYAPMTLVRPASSVDCTPDLERFAALVAAREREACARICDAEGREWDSDAVVTLKNYAEHCAAAIRARAEKETK